MFLHGCQWPKGWLRRSLCPYMRVRLFVCLQPRDVGKYGVVVHWMVREVAAVDDAEQRLANAEGGTKTAESGENNKQTRRNREREIIINAVQREIERGRERGGHTDWLDVTCEHCRA